MTGELHPAINACLNGASAVFIFAAWRAIKRGDRGRHERWMLTALGLSMLFLISYVIRFLMSGTHRYPVEGWTKVVYLAVLASHTLLAMAVPFLVGRAVIMAYRGRFDAHRRVVRFALPIWFYVSVTGVVIYLMLYQLAPRLG
jgi:putative membrane protein